MKFEIQTSTKGHLKDKDKRIFFRENVIITREKLMHPICPAQKRIENNFTSIVEELFTKMAGADQAAVVRENSIKSEKKKKKNSRPMGVHAVLHLALH